MKLVDYKIGMLREFGQPQQLIEATEMSLDCDKSIVSAVLKDRGEMVALLMARHYPSYVAVGLILNKTAHLRVKKFLLAIKDILKWYSLRVPEMPLLTDCPEGMSRWLKMVGFKQSEGEIYTYQEESWA